MENFKFTKGKGLKPNGTTIIQSDNGSEICDYAGYKTTMEEDDANGLLISKAPEMIEALKDVVSKYYNDIDINITHINDIEKLIKEATTL